MVKNDFVVTLLLYKVTLPQNHFNTLQTVFGERIFVKAKYFL